MEHGAWSLELGAGDAELKTVQELRWEEFPLGDIEEETDNFRQSNLRRLM